VPVKRRIEKRRVNDFAAWDATLRCGCDFFGDLAPAELEPGHHGQPRVEAARSAWGAHGARVVAEAALLPVIDNGSVWGLWAFGPPPGAEPEAVAHCLAMMRADWGKAPDWADRQQAEEWRQGHQQSLRRSARFTGEAPPWALEHFPEIERAGDR
jgi:hypothetical protein